MTGSADTFSALLAGRAVPHSPWVPFLEPVAARLLGTELAALIADPTAWTMGLTRAAELLDADALTVGFDWTLTARACGARPSGADSVVQGLVAPDVPAGNPTAHPLQAACLETVARLVNAKRDRAAVVAAVVGPATLGTQLAPHRPVDEQWRHVKAAHTAVTEGVLKGRPHLVLFLEHRDGAWAEAGRPLVRAYSTVRNLAGYYAVPVGIYVEHWSCDALPALADLKPDVVVLGASAADPIVALELLPPDCAVGVPVPLNDASRADAIVAAVNDARAAGRRLFITTPGPIPGDSDLAALRRLANAVRAGG